MQALTLLIATNEHENVENLLELPKTAHFSFSSHPTRFTSGLRSNMGVKNEKTAAREVCD
jgi:hypothetical protein